MKHVLIVDNFDSFTYNLVHYVEQCVQGSPIVVRNDALAPDLLLDASHVILSPGPGLPSEAGDLMPFVALAVDASVPVLGVCLGHQALVQFFGGKLKNLPQVHHGVQHSVEVTSAGCPLLGQSGTQLNVGRYHSWVADRDHFPSQLIATSQDSEGEIMSFRHRVMPVYGVQFHPESIMTENGLAILSQFLKG